MNFCNERNNNVAGKLEECVFVILMPILLSQVVAKCIVLLNKQKVEYLHAQPPAEKVERGVVMPLHFFWSQIYHFLKLLLVSLSYVLEEHKRTPTTIASFNYLFS
jgi:hypothetical protein